MHRLINGCFFYRRTRRRKTRLDFEFWLLLHFQERTAWLRDADATIRELRRHLPRYEKSTVSLADFAEGVDDAVRRAKAAERDTPHHTRNPSTSVWRLVERIRAP
ncbi:RloB-like protein [Actinoalloteichus sp. GBA129-24]|uniref:RloB-like protein n=1 Tax=Actinoalloteichus fjordicus TaxID=1612552 RepID=A0AAC9L9S4_9PSEU|nr:RloB-like protein [Actinoalloteichus fjordicus]APU19914.1 RloB-like protein [Actinoalloteichus sp. GBA129-24]